MSLIEYKNNDANMKAFKEDLKYWSNGCGELHHYGEYDIEESDLPKELSRAYKDLWTDGGGSLCYLVEYKDSYGIALINEFDNYFAEDMGISMDSLYEKMIQKANALTNNDLFKEAQIVCSEYAGFNECHELIVILPTNTEKETFNRIMDYIYKTVYDLKL